MDLSQALSQGHVPVAYHVLFILLLMASFILFCHSAIRLCMATATGSQQTTRLALLQTPGYHGSGSAQEVSHDADRIQRPPPAYYRRTNRLVLRTNIIGRDRRYAVETLEQTDCSTSAVPDPPPAYKTI